MRVPDALLDHVDFITALASLVGAFSCVYLQQTIVKETAPGVFLQRASLSLLAIALLANGLFVFPEWALINGHRPTGILVEITTAVNMIIMAGRGYVKFHPGTNRHSEPPHRP